jgi:hypothetical protein
LNVPELSKTWLNGNPSETNNFRRQNTFDFRISSSNRFYNESKWYFEVNPFAAINGGGVRSIEKRSWDGYYEKSDDKNSDFGVGAGSEIRYGYGRVEPVEDMRQLVYILNDLKKAGRLKRDLTQEETILLAEKLSILKNRRFLDSRLRLIEEMAEIEKVMTEMDLIVENDALFFSTINDYWTMAANPMRSSGSRLSLGVKPQINYSKDGNSNKTSDNSHTISSSTSETRNRVFNSLISASYEKFKPINLYWQQDYNLGISVYYANINTNNVFENNETSYNYLLSQLEGIYSLKYFPNSRTSYSGNAIMRLKRIVNSYMPSSDADFLQNEIESYVYLSAVRYFSPQLSLSGSLGIDYSYRNQPSSGSSIAQFKNRNSGSLTIGLGMYYILF